MSGIARDIRFAARRLSARPGFTAIAAFTLAIGIGATTTVFTVVNSVLIRPLPYHEPDALVMLVIAAAMGLLLGVIGIYGVLAYSVTQRFREIGIRAALGAPEIELKRLFLRDGILLALAGVALGLPAAAILTRLLRGLLFGVTPIDPTTYGIVSMLMTAAAAVASYVPARRAARVNPLVALRYE